MITKYFFIGLLITMCLTGFAQKNKKEPFFPIEIITVDSTAFTNYIWIKADRKKGDKTERINLMSEKKNTELSVGNLTLITQGETYFKMEIKPLDQIKMDNGLMKTEELIFTFEGRTITGAGKTFYYSDCLDGLYIKNECIKDMQKRK